MGTQPSRSRRRRALAGTLGCALWCLACRGPEEELVERYFAATRRGDNQMVAALAMVAFPEEVEEWRVLGLSEPVSEPYVVPGLRDSVEAIEDERDAQFRVFGDFRRENYDDLARIQRQLRDEPDFRFSGRLGELQQRWDGFREERREVVAKLRTAELALEREIRRVTKSLQRESTPEYLQGQRIQREARVRVTTPSGDRHVRVTLSRYELENQFGAVVPSRWIITAISESED